LSGDYFDSIPQKRCGRPLILVIAGCVKARDKAGNATFLVIPLIRV
jgi:hypothetical protein